MVKKLAVAAIITIGLFVLVEGCLRATLVRCTAPEPNLCRSDEISYRYNEADGGGDLVPNQDGVWAIWPHRPYHVQTNSDGLRNAEEVDPHAELTILAVGDSFTFGPYVPNEDTWPAWLEHMLRTSLGPGVQVLNGGVARYTIQDEHHYLAERGLSLEPDLVIIAFYPNDISDFRGIQRDYLAQAITTNHSDSVLSRVRASVLDLENRLAIVQLATRFKRSMEVSEVQWRQATSEAHVRKTCDPFLLPAEDDPDPCWTQFDVWIRRTISMLQAKQTQVLVVAIPDQRQLDGRLSATVPQDFVAAVVSEEEARFLDLLTDLSEVSDPESLYLQRWDPVSQEHLGNAHMSSYGYQQVARQIASELENSDLLH